MKTIKCITLGCKVNQYDTQVIREKFTRAGFVEVTGSTRATVCVINTCTVTHRADSESLYFIRKCIADNRGAKIIVTGCLAELDAERIKSVGGIDLVVRNKDKKDLYRAFETIAGQSGSFKDDEVGFSGITSFFGHSRAFVKVQDGCNNRCAYCKVPLVRGPSKSRTEKDILEEVVRLAGNGYKEIVLTGICLGAYGRDVSPRTNLTRLIQKLECVEGIERIRLSSLEAGDVTAGLINQMFRSKKLCRHLHIPIQSGDDLILKAMNRRYTSKGYLALIGRIKKRIPDIAITTDCLVGFPGETEACFENTVKLVNLIAPLKAHIFPYSLRLGTAASSLPGPLDPVQIKQRVALLKKAADTYSKEYKLRNLGKVAEVLIEGRVRNTSGWWHGYTDTYINVQIKSRRDLANKLVRVKLNSIDGEIVKGVIS